MGVIPVFLILGFAMCASLTDISRYKVYNYVTYPCFFLGVGYGAVSDGLMGVLISLSGAAIGFAILVMPYIMGGLGAGDVKFVMAMGAWLGPRALLPAIVSGCIATGVYALVVASRRQGFANVWANIRLMVVRVATIGRHFVNDDQFESVQSIAARGDGRHRLIPFTAMISLGVLGVVVVQLVFAAVRS